MSAKAIGLGILWASTLAIALVGGWSIMYRVSYVVLLLIAASSAWAWLSGRSTSIARS